MCSQKIYLAGAIIDHKIIQGVDSTGRDVLTGEGAGEEVVSCSVANMRSGDMWGRPGTYTWTGDTQGGVVSRDNDNSDEWVDIDTGQLGAQAKH